MDSKAETLQEMMKCKIDEYFPLKTLKVTDDDKPWVNQKVKELDSKCKIEFHKNRKSKRGTELREKIIKLCKKVKEEYFRNTVEDLKTSIPGQWYSKLKRMGGLSKDRAGSI